MKRKWDAAWQKYEWKFSWFEEWFLKRLIRQIVQQDLAHGEKITQIYTLIRVEAEKEFYEDNIVTLNSNLRDWFEKSLRKESK